MSNNIYPHYQEPSSLPSSYAVMSRFNPELDPPETEADDIPDDPNGVSIRQGFNPQTIGPFGSASYAAKRRGTFSSSLSARPSIPRNLLSPVPGSPAVPPEDMAPSERAPLLPRESRDQENKQPKTSSFWRRFAIELATLFRYSVPIFGTQVLEYSLTIASVISIGHISTNALAGCTLGNMTGGVTGYSIIAGMACALDTLLPSAWTSEDPKMVGVWTQRMVVLMTVLLVPMFAVWFNAEPILLFLRQEPEVAHYAGEYLKYASIGLPAFAYNTIAKRYFQSQGKMLVPTVITIIIAPINLFLNWLLVWGPKPVNIGFIGAPLATSFSFNLILVLFLIYGIFFAPSTAWHPISRRSVTRLGELIILGISGVGLIVSEWWSWEVVALAASLLGPSSLAAQSVILSTAGGLWQASNALSISAAVRVGNLLGAGQAKEAGLASKVGLFMALIAATGMCTLLICFRHNWAYMFNSDPQVVQLVSEILPLCAFFQFFDSMATVSFGVLRGIGKQSYGALINVTAYYVIGIPFGLWLTFAKDMKLYGLWTGLTVALIYASLSAAVLVLRSDWDHEVAKVQARFEAEQLTLDIERRVALGGDDEEE